VLRAQDIPIAPAAVTLSQQTGRSPLEHALQDGEDFELIFTLAPDQAQRLLDHPPIPHLAPIGVCLPDLPPTLWLELPDGHRQPLPPRGWSHPM
jgi:thiamine-monophosphate kinase